MPLNTLVRPGPYTPPADLEATKASVLAAVEGLVRLPGLTVKHRRELLSIALWKWTEAAGVAPHARYNLRYASAGALNRDDPAPVHHEHVWPRKWIIDRLLARSSWKVSELRELLTKYGVGCIVTVAEHAKLGQVNGAIQGWDRYAAAEVTVYDLASNTRMVWSNEAEIRAEADRTIDAATELSEELLDQDAAHDDAEDAELPADARSEAGPYEALDRYARDKAPLLRRLVRTMTFAGSVTVLPKRPNNGRPAYLRLHDTIIPEPTRTVAWIHWSGKVSIGLSPGDLVGGELDLPFVKTQNHQTYGVACYVTDEASLEVAEDLVSAALDKLRVSFNG